MRNTTNAFDGAVWRLESPERWRLHILASRPVLIDPEAASVFKFEPFGPGL